MRAAERRVLQGWPMGPSVAHESPRARNSRRASDLQGSVRAYSVRLSFRDGRQPETGARHGARDADWAVLLHPRDCAAPRSTGKAESPGGMSSHVSGAFLPMMVPVLPVLRGERG